MRHEVSRNEGAKQRIATCEWVPGANKHRTLLDVETTLVAPSNETSPFSPSGGTFGHGMMWRPNAARLEELNQMKDDENRGVQQYAWGCVLISLGVALGIGWLLTEATKEHEGP